jgi:hypothetical protein
MGTTPISTLGVQVQNRLEESTGAPGIFWNLSTELYSGIIEGINDLLILVGRPSFSVNQPFTLTAGTVWQTLPKSQLLITDIQGATSPLWRVSLFDMDYVQASWNGAWESDTAAAPLRWGPVGFGSFFVHPAPTTAVVVNITSIPYPTTDNWPYLGSETVVFRDEYFQYLEMYAAHVARIKEGGLEWKESMELYQQYLEGAKRLTQIESKKDPVLFNFSLGGIAGLRPIQKR